jgi:hypothetical protein
VNGAWFDAALAIALGDQAGATYNDSDRAAATLRALSGYSQYRPVMRRFSNANLACSVAVGAKALQVIGGVWSNGDTAILDPLSGAPETITINGVSTTTGGQMGVLPITHLALVAPLASTHPLSALMVKQPTSGQTSAGLAIVAATDTYRLPLDWIRPEQASFDLAVGMKGSVNRGDGFYDAGYGMTDALSGVGGGESSNFAGGYFSAGAADGYGLGGKVFGGCPGGGTVYRFLTSSPPLLIISPVPQTAAVLDFYYYGMHTIESAPERDSDALIALASYSALTARARTMAAELDHSTGASIKQEPSKSAAALLAMAQEAHGEFESRVVWVPYATSG